MHIRFRHTKTQQHGEAKRHRRACYSNPFNWEMDLPLLLALYLATGFNTPQGRGKRLFPGGGKSQSARIGALMKMCLEEHKEEVLMMGYDSLLVDKIGLHSIRKGVSTYLASLPGGPPPAALCLRAGWSMGQVKDIYFHQSQGVDEFVGRCASMLNLMNGEFASSPAFFKDSADSAGIKTAVSQVFPHFDGCDGMGRLLEQCLASLVFHQDKILSLPPNHLARSISLFRDPQLRTELAQHVTIVSAWGNPRKAARNPTPHQVPG